MGGKLIAFLMAALAEFERDLLRERVRSGIAAARKRGVVFGRRPGQRVKADRFAPKVLKLVGEGQSYREISHRLGLSKNTILDIVKTSRVNRNTFLRRRKQRAVMERPTVFSASKPFMAVLIYLLAERDQVRLDEPVATYWPEFAQHGKSPITIRQVLQHRSGLGPVHEHRRRFCHFQLARIPEESILFATE
jgi:CubicO group peptidase (beta-lactamase class C family)